MARRLEGWTSVDRRGADGAVESSQRMPAARPVVEASPEGARRLGHAYWLAVRRASGGLVRARESGCGVELHLLGLRPPLLQFRTPRVAARDDDVTCTYEIAGGLLARRPGGTLGLAQTGGSRPELCVAVAGFVPRVQLLYEPLERLFHASVSRHYFRRLVAGRST